MEASAATDRNKPQALTREGVLAKDHGRRSLPWASISFVIGSSFALPFVLGRPLALGADFTYHGALIESQYQSLQALGRWSPFLDSLGGVDRFSMRPAVYGGTTYGLIAPLRFLFPLGAVMAIVFAVSFGCIAWGVFTAARAGGIRPVAAVSIATITVSSGSVLSVLYGRSAIAELVAWASLSAGIGAYAAIRSGSPSVFSRSHDVVLLLAATMFFGGHPLTLVFASALAGLVLLLALIAGARPTRRDLRPALLVALGVCLTLWQWPLTLQHLSLTQAPSADLPITTGGFIAPLGPGSGPNLAEALDPTRLFTSTASSGIHNHVPALALGLLLAILATRLWTAPRVRQLIVPGFLACVTVSILALPHSERLVSLVPMLGAMQYHWRLYPYAVATGTAALVLVVRLISRNTQRRATVALAAIAAVSFIFGQVQVWTPVSGQRTATISDASVIASLDPNPVYRNDGIAERDKRLPVLDQVDLIAEPVKAPDHAEDVLIADGAESGLVAVPSALAPPFVGLAPGDRAVGWYGVDRDEPEEYESEQFWLVVDHRSGLEEITVHPSSAPLVRLAQLGGWTWIVVLVLVIREVIVGQVGARRAAPSLVQPDAEGPDD